jgi:hypothetical protein
MVTIMTLFAITNHHWPICWMTCFILFVWLSFPYWLWQRVIPYSETSLKRTLRKPVFNEYRPIV